MSTIGKILAEIHGRLKECTEGEVASYIPELSKADPSWYGISIFTTDGHHYSVGDCDKEFTIQSISKAFCYGMALDNHGLDDVLNKIGVEPSGEAFNEISLEDGTGRPLNPMINAGAIAATGLVPGTDADSRFDFILEKLSAFAGRELDVDEDVYRSESATGFRNRAIAYLLRNSEIIDDPVEDTVEAYFRQCSILINCEDLALMGASLANGGVNPVTGEKVLEPNHVEKVLSVMGTCGMYDATGEWIFKVGLPAKSGVGGGILGVLPGQLGVAVFSPPLDAKGNSARGLKTFDEFSKRFNLHLFNLPPLSEFSIRNVYRLKTVESNRQRPLEDRDILHKYGDKVALIEMQGELFFSSMERALREAEIENMGCEIIIFDFTRVGYADSASQELLISASHNLAEDYTKTFVIDPKGAFQRSTIPGAVEIFSKTDLALEAAERYLIEKYSEHRAEVSGLVPFYEFEIFAGLSSPELSLIESMIEMQSYKAGETIVCQGGDPDYLYLLAKGQTAVDVIKDGQRNRLRSFSKGVSFGELAIIDDTKRSADIIAETSSVCYLLSAESYHLLERKHTEIYAKVIRNLFRINIDILRSNSVELAVLKGEV